MVSLEQWHAKCNRADMKPEDGIEMVTCLIEMRLDPGEVDRAFRLLLSVVESIEAKVGCHSCSVSREKEPNRIRYREIWTTEAVFRNHVRSMEFQHVLVAMDMCCERPRVTVETRLGKSGIHYLEELRCDPKMTLGRDTLPE